MIIVLLLASIVLMVYGSYFNGRIRSQRLLGEQILKLYKKSELLDSRLEEGYLYCMKDMVYFLDEEVHRLAPGWLIKMAEKKGRKENAETPRI